MKQNCLIGSVFLLVSGLLVPAAEAGLFDTTDYDQCVIQTLSEVKLDLVAKEMVRICDETYKHNRFVSKQKKAYNECLMENLPSVESVIAAREIMQACHRIHME